jgi:hypothetical protein
MTGTPFVGVESFQQLVGDLSHSGTVDGIDSHRAS